MPLDRSQTVNRPVAVSTAVQANRSGHSCPASSANSARNPSSGKVSASRASRPSSTIAGSGSASGADGSGERPPRASIIRMTFAPMPGSTSAAVARSASGTAAGSG